MTAHYSSKHGQVARRREELYMAFTDLRNFTQMLPANLQGSVTADFDNLRADFSIDLDANLNFMMKAMLGGKLQEALDKIVDGLVGASEGRMPDMPDTL